MFNKSLNTLSPLFDDERDTLRSITSSSSSSSSSSNTSISSTLPLESLRFNSTFSSNNIINSIPIKQLSLSNPSILHEASAPSQFKSSLAPPSLLSSSSSSSKALSFPSFSTPQPSLSTTSTSSSSSIPLLVSLTSLPCPPSHLEFSSTLQLLCSSEQQWSVCWKAVHQFLSQLEFATQVVPSRHRTNKLKCSSTNVNFCIYFYCLPSSTTLLIEFQRRSGCCILFHHMLKRVFDSLTTLLPTLKMYAPNNQHATRQSVAHSSTLSSSASCSTMPTFPSLLLPLSSSVSASSSSVYQTSTPLYFQLLSQQPNLNMSTSSPSLAVSS